MATTVLLVETDSRRLHVLSLALARAGFEVVSARTNEELEDELENDRWSIAVIGAHNNIRNWRPEDHPDLITGKEKAFIYTFPDGSFDRPPDTRTGFSAVVEEPAPAEKIVESVRRANRQLRLAIALRGGSVPEKEEKAGLLETLLVAHRFGASCRIQFTPSKDGADRLETAIPASIDVHEGQIIDATAGVLSGSNAFQRLVIQEDAELQFLPLSSTPRKSIDMETKELLNGAFRRWDEWSITRNSLPALNSRFAVNHEQLAEGAALPPEAKTVIRRLEDGDSIRETLSSSGLDELVCLMIIEKLRRTGALRTKDEPERAAAPELDAWITGLPGPSPLPTPEMEPEPVDQPMESLETERPSEVSQTVEIQSRESAERVATPLSKTSAAWLPEPDAIKLQPNRKPVIVGAIVLLAVAAVLAITPSSQEQEQAAKPPTPETKMEAEPIETPKTEVAAADQRTRQARTEPPNTDENTKENEEKPEQLEPEPATATPMPGKAEPGDRSTVAKKEKPETKKPELAAQRRQKKRQLQQEVTRGLKRAEQALVEEQTKSAVQGFRKVLKIESDSASARSGLAYALLMNEDLAGARREARTTLKRNPNNARAHVVLGHVAATEENSERAIRHYERFLKLAPRSPDAVEVRKILASLR